MAALLVASASVGVATGAVVATRDRSPGVSLPTPFETAPSATPCPGPSVAATGKTRTDAGTDAGTGIGEGAGSAGGTTSGGGCAGGVGGPAPAATTAGPAGGPAEGPTVPVYVLGDVGAGPRLYREFRPKVTADPVTAALVQLARPPADPDYRTAWTGRTAAVTRVGAAVTVTFAGAPRDLRLAREQVVWTVTAADRSVTRVRVVAPGLPDRPAAGRGDQAGVLAPVWLLDPVDGGTAARSLTVSGTASVFEATVSVEVRRGTAVVARATATASVGAPGRGAWSARVSVPPGTYVVAAYEESAKDGSRVGVDTKRVTVSGR